METESRELAAISRGKIKAGSTDDWKSEQLFVPPLPPTNLRGCHLIRIQYDVFVSNYLFIPVPIKLGNFIVNVSKCLHVVISLLYFSSSLLRVISKNLSSSSFRSCWQPILLGMRTERWGGRTRQNTRLHCQYSDHGWMKRTCDNQSRGRMKTRTMEITGNVKRIFIRQKILTTGISSLPITNLIS